MSKTVSILTPALPQQAPINIKKRISNGSVLYFDTRSKQKLRQIKTC
jgi:hypothetical protein